MARKAPQRDAQAWQGDGGIRDRARAGRDVAVMGEGCRKVRVGDMARIGLILIRI